jgi:hypothetical protein
MGMEDHEGEQREPTPNENKERGQRPAEIYDQCWQGKTKKD